MNTKQSIIDQTNRLYIELGKFQDALHTVRNLWLPRCVAELLEDKIQKTQENINILEKQLENIRKNENIS